MGKIRTMPKSGTGQDTKLDKLREQIYGADSAILSALGARMRIVKKIGVYKRAHHMEPFDAKLRNERKNSWIRRGARLGFPKKFISDIYMIVHDHTVALERKAK